MSDNQTPPIDEELKTMAQRSMARVIAEKRIAQLQNNNQNHKPKQDTQQ